MEVGLAVRPLERRIDLPDMIAYAGATWDWHRLHYDGEYAAHQGFPAPVVDGQMLGALLAECVQDWLGPSWTLATLSFRFRHPVFAGQTVRCTGTVTSATDAEVAVDLRILILSADGTPDQAAVEPAAATLRRRG